MERKVPICKDIRVKNVDVVCSKLPSDEKIAESSEFSGSFQRFLTYKNPSCLATA